MVHLRRHILLLSSIPPSHAVRGGETEIDELDEQGAALPKIGQRYVLEREVAMRDAQLVQPADGTEQLEGDELHLGLVLLSESIGFRDPREEVALRGKGGDHISASVVAEDAMQRAHEWEADAVQILRDAKIA